MKFYSHRSVEDQMNRLPLELREKYRTTQLDRIYIDGELITGYFEYSFMEEKSYTEQPTRASDGSIRDLNNYTTFLTPRLIIRYNMMNIEDYRKLMKILKSKNAFIVECYDIVEDKRVTHEMYFATPSMPIIYQQYLMTLGIREYTIELIGTNNKGKYTVLYDYNLNDTLKEIYIRDYGDNTPQKSQDMQAPYNMLYIVGGKNAYIPTTLTTISEWALSNGYILSNWNTSKNGDGISYKNDFPYFLNRDLVLYAQWV